ncbi:MAG: monofunctional biosynthetic peptidoglycan transglycosylase [Vicinamibacteria bacterium]|nr:monofunctional biosynthetic peptidoglycan transglycosylase [Vicinamibacteria bacterium]
MRRIFRWIKRGAQALLAGTVLMGTWILLGLPWRSAVRDLAQQVPDVTSVMRQREDEARAAGRKPRHIQKTVPLRSISKNLIHAVLSAEDPNFFGHEGIDWDAIKESIETNIEEGRYARGGSTITQQLAKNLFFTTRKSLIRKAREAIVATWMEHDLEKKRIIEIYLNVIEWGDGVYGCEAAARRYYGSSCGALDVDQAAGLAAMIPSPRRINPRTNPGLHARATRRVLRRMRWAGYLKRDIRDMGKAPEKILLDETEAGPEPQEQDDPPVPPTPTPTPTSPPAPTGGPVSGRGHNSAFPARA